MIHEPPASNFFNPLIADQPPFFLDKCYLCGILTHELSVDAAPVRHIFTQVLCSQYLQTSLSATPLQSTLTDAPRKYSFQRRYNPYRINTYEKQGGPPLPEFPSTSETLSRRCRGRA